MSETEFEDMSGTFIFTQFYLEFCKFNEIVLMECIYSQLCDHSFKDLSGSFFISVSELEFGHFEVGFKGGKSLQISV